MYSNHHITETKYLHLKLFCHLPVNKLQTIYQKRPNAYILQVFFDAKSDEIVSLFKEGPNMDTAKLVSVLKQIDGARNNKYEAIVKR